MRPVITPKPTKQTQPTYMQDQMDKHKNVFNRFSGQRPVQGSGPLGFIVDKLKSVPRSGFKKGGKTTTLHSITKSGKKSNW